jgi:hypothetical protein
VSVEIDQENAIHVGYAPLGHVAYAQNRDDVWTTEDIGSFEQDPRNGYPSLALDSDGGVHIAWYIHGYELDSDLPPESGRYAVLARPNDDVDQNCDGADGVDADGDGRASVETGADDLDDTVPDP